MKFTSKQLRQIIKEELEFVLKEYGRHLNPGEAEEEAALQRKWADDEEDMASLDVMGGAGSSLYTGKEPEKSTWDDSSSQALGQQKVRTLVSSIKHHKDAMDGLQYDPDRGGPPEQKTEYWKQSDLMMKAINQLKGLGYDSKGRPLRK